MFKGGFKNKRLKKPKKTSEYFSWLVQLLSFSGHEEYRAAIEWQVDSPNKKLSRHASNSLITLSDFRLWNPVINKNLSGLIETDLRLARIENMLVSDIPQMNRVAVKMISTHYLDDPLMIDKVEEKLLAIHGNVGGDQEKAEAVAWMCKVLGLSKNKKYLSTLEQVRASATTRAVKRWVINAKASLGVGPMHNRAVNPQSSR